MDAENTEKRIDMQLTEQEADRILQERIKAAAPKPADFKKLPLAEQREQLRRLGVRL
ncbi:MAG: hypothetical protein AB7C98_09090 [Acidithiobacillus sp.]